MRTEAALRPRTLAPAVLVVALAWTIPSAAGAQELSSDAQRVVTYLLEDWGKRFRSTSIPLAMDNLGVEENDALRLEIGQHFRDHADLARNLRFWGANNYIFTNEEKRIAKLLIGARERDDRTPSLQEAARTLAISEVHVTSRLAFMAEAGFLRHNPTQPLGFSLTANYKPWGGPLQHNFHTVKVEGEQPFDVW